MFTPGLVAARNIASEVAYQPIERAIADFALEARFPLRPNTRSPTNRDTIVDNESFGEITYGLIPDNAFPRTDSPGCECGRFHHIRIFFVFLLNRAGDKEFLKFFG